MVIDEQTDGQKNVSVVALAWGIYQQTAAIIGAFAILAFLTNFVDFSVRGWLATMISVWDESVRPVVRWVLHYVVEVPLSWLGWHVEVPQWLRDYLAVGVVLTSSWLRVDAARSGRRKMVTDFLLPNIKRIGRWAPIHIVAWPFMLLSMIFVGVFVAATRNLRSALWMLTVVSPLIYAGILLALNYTVL